MDYRTVHIEPKKSLGQNFLIDLNIAQKATHLLEVAPEDIIIEIGPGKGVLTQYLADYPNEIYAIEIDNRLSDLLTMQFPSKYYPNIHIINEDFIKFDFSQITNSQNLAVIGNLPYYLTSSILFKLFDNYNFVKNTVIMVQKEVANRLLSSTDTKLYGILPIALSFYGKITSSFNVPAYCFYPQPTVHSKVLSISFYKSNDKVPHSKEIMNMVKLIFQQRRKKLSNALESYLYSCGIDFKVYYDNLLQNQQYNILEYFDKRPENLSRDDFISLFNSIQSLITNSKE
ncbi:MAG TPA: 16S rRNA (adenine(1518)-N(6)/adenine(1519)-N(6))-dimethyltransferase RsmA [Candidatus Kapabacteria bacterium]|nr:16S rRNA (adenine(1518)-N(6)/adenine(1519)-N(6))-dimethyltransferase RsmA [Candidatus Kapabacteria bacterium]